MKRMDYDAVAPEEAGRKGHGTGWDCLEYSLKLEKSGMASCET